MFFSRSPFASLVARFSAYLIPGEGEMLVFLFYVLFLASFTYHWVDYSAHEKREQDVACHRDACPYGTANTL